MIFFFQNIIIIISSFNFSDILIEYTILTLTINNLGKIFSSQQFEIFLPENRIWHFKQIISIGDDLHEKSDPVFLEK